MSQQSKPIGLITKHLYGGRSPSIPKSNYTEYKYSFAVSRFEIWELLTLDKFRGLWANCFGL